MTNPEPLQRRCHKRDSLALHKVHNYYVGEEIACGVFTSVRRAFYKQTCEEVIVRLISKRKLAKTENKDDIIFSEGTLRQLLKHPHIAQIREVVESRGQIFQFMDKYDSDLLTLLQHTEVKISHKIQILSDLLSALEYLHRHQVCHRDIKLENILVDSKYRGYLSDFAFAALCDGKIHGCFGTVGYTAPEVFEDSPYDGMSADIWSFGVVMYILFSGRLPFAEGEHNLGCVDFNLIPNDVREIVRMCLRLDPTTRPTAASIRCMPLFSGIQALAQRVCGHRPSVTNATDFEIMVVSDAFDTGFDEARRLLEEPAINKATLFFWLLKDSTACHRRSLSSISRHVSSSLPVKHSPLLLESLEHNFIKMDTHMSPTSLKKYFLERNFCVSMNPSGEITAVLNRPGDDMVLNLVSLESTEGGNVLIGSADSESVEMSDFLCDLKEGIHV